jgi:hypothetical protein
MSTNDQQEQQGVCQAVVQKKDSQKLTRVLHPEERDRAMELCRLLQDERNVDQFTALCEELNELLERMRAPGA